MSFRTKITYTLECDLCNRRVEFACAKDPSWPFSTDEGWVCFNPKETDEPDDEEVDTEDFRDARCVCQDCQAKISKIRGSAKPPFIASKPKPSRFSKAQLEEIVDEDE